MPFFASSFPRRRESIPGLRAGGSVDSRLRGNDKKKERPGCRPWSALALIISVGIAAASSTAQAADASAFQKLISDWYQDDFRAHPMTAGYAGFHQYDGKMEEGDDNVEHSDEDEDGETSMWMTKTARMRATAMRREPTVLRRRTTAMKKTTTMIYLTKMTFIHVNIIVL